MFRCARAAVCAQESAASCRNQQEGRRQSVFVCARCAADKHSQWTKLQDRRPFGPHSCANSSPHLGETNATIRSPIKGGIIIMEQGRPLVNLCVARICVCHSGMRGQPLLWASNSSREREQQTESGTGAPLARLAVCEMASAYLSQFFDDSMERKGTLAGGGAAVGQRRRRRANGGRPFVLLVPFLFCPSGGGAAQGGPLVVVGERCHHCARGRHLGQQLERGASSRRANKFIWEWPRLSSGSWRLVAASSSGWRRSVEMHTRLVCMGAVWWARFGGPEEEEEEEEEVGRRGRIVSALC